MKKLLKENLKMFIAIIITAVVTTTTTIFAYSLIAENVGFTPHDNTWNVQDVEAALNDLNLRENQLSTHYSYDEQVVGRWVDGKPLYQKTIYLGNPPNDSTKTYQHNIADIDKVVNHYGFMISTNDGSFSNLPIWNTTGDGIRVVVTTTEIRLHAHTSWSAYVAYITLQYTKTTD